MIAPVGKSGPFTIRQRASIDTSGSSRIASSPLTISPRLCGGMFVAMPTAMPAEPFTRRFGTLAGSTMACMRVSS